jgi:hypothetical protein
MNSFLIYFDLSVILSNDAISNRQLLNENCFSYHFNQQRDQRQAISSLSRSTSDSDAITQTLIGSFLIYVDLVPSFTLLCDM